MNRPEFKDSIQNRSDLEAKQIPKFTCQFAIGKCYIKDDIFGCWETVKLVLMFYIIREQSGRTPSGT